MEKFPLVLLNVNGLQKTHILFNITETLTLLILSNILNTSALKATIKIVQ